MEIAVSGRCRSCGIDKQGLEVLGLPPAKRGVTSRLCRIAIQAEEQEGYGSDRDIFIFHSIISWLISKQNLVHLRCREPLCHHHSGMLLYGRGSLILVYWRARLGMLIRDA